MTRRFNYTDRKRLGSDNFRARVVTQDPLSATIHLDLADRDLPPDADVFAEAYVGTISRRFHLGTVEKPEVPAEIDLSDLQSGNSIQFRARVVENGGRLLASVERVRLKGLNEDQNRQPLLPVEKSPELGELIWRIDVSESTHPKLVLNSKVPSIENRILDDPLIGGAVLLPAVRKVLEVLIENPGGDVWQENWLTFARNWEPDTSVDDELDAERKEEWVETVLAGFASAQQFASRTMPKSVEDEDQR